VALAEDGFDFTDRSMAVSIRCSRNEGILKLVRGSIMSGKARPGAAGRPFVAFGRPVALALAMSLSSESGRGEGAIQLAPMTQGKPDCGLIVEASESAFMVVIHCNLAGVAVVYG
jgi:hypothetical protein